MNIDRNMLYFTYKPLHSSHSFIYLFVTWFGTNCILFIKWKMSQRVSKALGDMQSVKLVLCFPRFFLSEKYILLDFWWTKCEVLVVVSCTCLTIFLNCFLSVIDVVKAVSQCLDDWHFNSKQENIANIHIPGQKTISALYSVWTALDEEVIWNGKFGW